MPEYFQYLKDNVLNIIPMLSRMCFGDLVHITNKYEDFLTIPDTNGSRNYFMKNTTNATVEKSFAIQKADK